MSKVVHFEIPAEDPQTKMTFFSNVFGWQFQPYGDAGYFLTTAGEDGVTGIGGAIMKRNHADQPLTNTIGVASIDDTIATIEANGGTIVVPKMEVGDMGSLAYFTDPEGMIHGLWEVKTQG
ncbi:MAG: VOC family protein [Candidatus Kapabacteria bacterium]|nr:VOC family protein [Candidatus Kapabacteria bacterium]